MVADGARLRRHVDPRSARLAVARGDLRAARHRAESQPVVDPDPAGHPAGHQAADAGRRRRVAGGPYRAADAARLDPRGQDDGQPPHPPARAEGDRAGDAQPAGGGAARRDRSLRKPGGERAAARSGAGAAVGRRQRRVGQPRGADRRRDGGVGVWPRLCLLPHGVPRARRRRARPAGGSRRTPRPRHGGGRRGTDAPV